MFPTGLVTATRARFLAAHGDTCDVWRNVGDTTAYGGQIDDWRRVYNDLACRVTGGSPREGIDAEGVTSDADFVLHCASSADIRPIDQVIYGGKTFDVVGTDGGRSQALALHVRLVLVSQEDLRT